MEQIIKSLKEYGEFIVFIIITGYGLIRFLERPNKENERQTHKLDSIETTLNNHGKEMNALVSTLSESVKRIDGKLETILHAQHESEKRVILIENDLKHQEEAIRAMRDMHTQNGEKVAKTLEVVAGVLVKLTDNLTQK